MVSSKFDLETDNMSVIQDRQADIDLAEAFGARVRLLANKSAMKQSYIAEKSGLDRRRINAYWHGKQVPTGENLLALAYALGADPRWLVLGADGSARQVLDEIDRMIEVKGNLAADARKADLLAIALDPDVAARYRNRADFYLQAMGDQPARIRHRAEVKKINITRVRIKEIVDAAVDQVVAETGIELGVGIRQSMVALCEHLAVSREDGIDAPFLNYILRQLAASILDRFGTMSSDRKAGSPYSASLHSPKVGFRGQDGGN